MTGETTTTHQPMQGKVCMVTGATAGIGKETARALAQQGAHAILVGRNPEKCAATVTAIQAQTGNQAVEAMVADLSSQAEIRQLADQFKREHQRLDVLVNNAGAIFLWRKESVDGLEMTFALNHIGYFLLTNLLLDTIKASAPARIVNVSSAAHRGNRLDFDDLQNTRRYGYDVYGQSKLANLHFTYELARRLEGTGVTVNALHPGFVASDFAANNGWPVRLFKPLINLMAIPIDKGAETSIYLASSPEVEGITGQYFVERKATRSSEASYDAEAARKLWEVSAALTGLAEPT